MEEHSEYHIKGSILTKQIFVNKEILILFNFVGSFGVAEEN